MDYFFPRLCCRCHRMNEVQAAVFVLCLVFASGAVWACENTIDPLSGLSDHLDLLREDHQVPGVAVVVVGLTPEPAIFVSGQLGIDDQTPVDEKTLFHIASVTKIFNATLAAIMVDQKLMTWDSRVQDIIPEFRLADRNTAAQVTLRDLLSHRTGYGSSTLPSFNLDEPPDWWLPRLELLQPEGEFRDKAKYSGVMATVAGLMISRAGNASWPQLLSKWLLDPLAMTSTTDIPTFGKDTIVANGHLMADGNVAGVPTFAKSVEVAQYGLFSSAHDLGIWIRFLLDRGVNTNGKRLVSDAALRETWTPQNVIRWEGNSDNPGIHAFGLGWRVSSRFGARWLSHSGGGIGFTTNLTLLPDRGVGVAVLTNRAVNAIPDLVSTRIMYGALGQPYPYPREKLFAMIDKMAEMKQTAREDALRERIEGSLPPVPLAAYAGTYSNELFSLVQVGVENEALTFRFHDIPLEVEHLHDNVFLFSNPVFDSLRSEFSVSDDGHVSSLLVELNHNGEKVLFNKTDGGKNEHNIIQ